MLRFWLKPALILLLGLALAALTARALGSTQPPHPALAGFTTGCENIPQPCWYGIVPGMTVYDTIPNVLALYQLEVQTGAYGSYETAMGTDRTSCVVTFEPYRVYFHDCTGLYLADLRTLIVNPGIMLEYGCPSTHALQLYYSGLILNIEAVEVIPPSLFIPIKSFDLNQMPDDVASQQELAVGLVSMPLRWRYLKIYDYSRGCFFGG